MTCVRPSTCFPPPPPRGWRNGFQPRLAESKLRPCRAQVDCKQGCCTWRKTSAHAAGNETTRAFRRRPGSVSLDITPIYRYVSTRTARIGAAVRSIASLPRPLRFRLVGNTNTEGGQIRFRGGCVARDNVVAVQ